MANRFNVMSTDPLIVQEVTRNLGKSLQELRDALRARFNYVPLQPLADAVRETRARAHGLMILEEGDDGIVRQV